MSRMAACALLSIVAFATACGDAGKVLPSVGSEPSTATTPTPLGPDEEGLPTSTLIGSGNVSLEPITGYGDFSQYEYWDVDWFEVVRLVVECANDNGVPVQLIPPGDGYSMSGIPPDQQEAARAVVQACRDGLHVPDPARPTQAQLEEHLGELIELKTCFEMQGYTIDDPPSLEVFIDSWDANPWHPYDSLIDRISYEEWNRLNVECPQP